MNAITEHLIHRGYEIDYHTPSESREMTARWANTFGLCWQNKSRQLHGAKAEIAYADQMVDSGHIIALPEGPARPPGAGRYGSLT